MGMSSYQLGTYLIDCILRSEVPILLMETEQHACIYEDIPDFLPAFRSIFVIACLKILISFINE